MALNTSAATIAPHGQIGMTSLIGQHTNVYEGMSLAEVEGGIEDRVEQEEEQQFGLPDFHVSQRADEPRPAPVAPEIREFLTALALNIAACRRWLAADPPDIRQASATMERMTRDARALATLISTSGHREQQVADAAPLRRS